MRFLLRQPFSKAVDTLLGIVCGDDRCTGINVAVLFALEALNHIFNSLVADVD